MSIQAVAWVLEYSASRGTDRLVLIVLANYANDDGLAWPSQRTVATKAGLGVGTVNESVRRLVALGELIVDEEGDARRSARYRLPFIDPGSSVQLPNAARGPRPNAGAFGSRTQRAAQGRTQRSAQAEQIHQEPSGTTTRAACSKCGGSGWQFGTGDRCPCSCSCCDGSGWIFDPAEGASKRCTECNAGALAGAGS